MKLSTVRSSLFLLMLSVITLASASSDSITSAMKNFDRAAAGDEAAVYLAIEQFELLLEEQPGQAMYEARLGSLITMQARDAWAPWKKMSYTERGLDRIDGALDALGEAHKGQLIAGRNISLDVRYTAAVTFAALPRFFNRWGQSERLLAELLEETAQGPAAFRAEIWLTRAQLARQREKQALYRQYLLKVISTDRDSLAGQRAQSLLAGVGGE